MIDLMDADDDDDEIEDEERGRCGSRITLQRNKRGEGIACRSEGCAVLAINVQSKILDSLGITMPPVC